MPTRLTAALCLGVVALCFAVGYLARTPLFSGKLVAGQLTRLATRASINLTVNDYRPAGLFGLRLQEVQLSARRGDYLLLADLDAVEIQPALKTLFTTRKLRPARVDVFGGAIHWKHRPLPAQPAQPTQPTESQADQSDDQSANKPSDKSIDPASGKKDPAHAISPSTPSQTPPDGSPEVPGTMGSHEKTVPGTMGSHEKTVPGTMGSHEKTVPILTVLHDVSFVTSVAPLPSMARPLVIHRADFMVPPGEPANFDFRHAYGRMPDGVAFVVKVEQASEPDSVSGANTRQDSPSRGRENSPAQSAGSRRGGRTYAVLPNEPTRLDRWFSTRLPAEISTRALKFCPECSPASMELDGLEFMGRAGTRARATRLSLRADEAEVQLGVPELTIYEPDQADAQQISLLYQLDELEWAYDMAAHSAQMQAEVIDAERGRATIAAHWSAERALLDWQVAMQDFHTAQFWPLLGIERAVQGGVHTGDVKAAYELALDLVEVSLDLKIRDVQVALGLVTTEPLAFETLGLEVSALFQPRARTFSVTRGRANFGEAGPVQFSGYALDARPGVVFDAAVHAEKLHPQELRDGLPETLGRLARGTEFRGEFGFSILTAGHTGFPDGITLSVDFNGEVQVLDDSSYADVLSLAGGGPPSVDLPGTLVRRVDLNQWINYPELPPHTPLVLAAAEDARFFSHDGFDWGGLRRAMAFNLREGGLKRGGSTLSQQLSKNLFLDHERTLARKLQEAYVTWRLEAELSKERIMELYINVVEWGPGISGVRRAAERYFEVGAEELSVAQTTLLAAILPGPSLFGSQVLNGYLPSSRLEKMEHILSNLRFMRVITPADYTHIYGRARRGWVDDLKLTVCADDHTAPDGTPPCP